MPKLLRMGERGEEVRQLQKLLDQHLPARGLRRDGQFGPATLAAVRVFQAAHGLSTDGIVGPSTWSAIRFAPAGNSGSAQSTAAPPWLAKAITQIGQKEVPGGKHNARICEYLRTTTNIASAYQNRDETAWCSAFVNWCLIQTGTRGTNHALASSWLRWGNLLDPPIKGAITVIQKSGRVTKDKATGTNTGYHVGFWIAETTTHVQLLGGNQGDQVKYSRFNKSAYRIRAYRWPFAPDTMARHEGIAYA